MPVGPESHAPVCSCVFAAARRGVLTRREALGSCPRPSARETPSLLRPCVLHNRETHSGGRDPRVGAPHALCINPSPPRDIFLFTHSSNTHGAPPGHPAPLWAWTMHQLRYGKVHGKVDTEATQVTAAGEDVGHREDNTSMFTAEGHQILAG